MVLNAELEQQRIASLHRLELLDTAAEPEFDELVELAALLCETPVSLITLVDADRQWFKSAVGISVRETPREVAFCDHAIRQSDLFIVEDATRDARFSANPLVTGEPSIRFYAGMPIAGPEGHNLGTLCVIDSKPRTLSAEQKRTLEILGRQVNTRLELRLRRRELQQALKDAEVLASELQTANTLLLDLVSTDPLTGLANRRAFAERLDVEIRAMLRHRPLSLLMLDIDHFKVINDTHGHIAGDDTLEQMGRLFKKNVRATELAARYGGEEFVVLLPGATEDEAAALAQRLVKSVHEAQWPFGPVTVSIGIAQAWPTLTKAPDLIAAADQALYAAKAAGRNQFQRHSALQP